MFIQYAIIDIVTRVIKGLTTIPDLKVDDTSELVGLAKTLKFPTDQYPDNKYWVLNEDLTVTPASDTQIELSGVDPDIVAGQTSARVLAYNQAIDIVIADGTIPESISDYFQKLKDLNG